MSAITTTVRTRRRMRRCGDRDCFELRLCVVYGIYFGGPYIVIAGAALVVSLHEILHCSYIYSYFRKFLR